MDLTEINNTAASKLEEKFKSQPEPAVEEPKEEVEETPVASEEAVEEQVTTGVSERESALLKEITRLKADRRTAVVETNLGDFAPTVDEEPEEQMDVTPAEARLFTAWRNEALEEVLEKYPQYKTDLKSWERFSKEYSDRVPELTVAKRDKIPVTKALFKDRMERVHRSLEDGSSKAREEGKKELLKTQSAAAVMGAGAAKASQPDSEKPIQKKRLLVRNNGGLQNWLTKK